MARRIAVVTGASRSGGIGAAVCRELAQRGASVFFTHYVPFDRSAGFDIGGGPEALLDELRSYGPAESMALDLAESGVAERLFDAVEASLGRPSVLVNNAAYWQAASYRNITEELVDRHIAVNVRAPLLLSSEFLRRIEGAGWGRIISLVSGQDHSGEVNNLPYGATKGSISAMTRYLALEVAPLSVTVNAVDPGPTDTGWMTDVEKQEIRGISPMGRIGLPEDAARAVAFLASEDAGWITGQVIRSDGGFPV